MPLLFLTAIAAWFRLYKIGSIPFGLNNDAAWEGSAALDIVRGNIAPYIPYAAEGWRGEGVVRAVIALFSLFLGADPVTIRLSTVFFGIALVPVVYLFVRMLCTNRLALLSAFFIATSGWHITMSKSGWRAVIVPLGATVTYFCLWKALTQKQIWWWGLCGIALAATLYTYDAARVLPLFLIFWILYSGRMSLKGLGALAVGFFVTIMPLAFYATTHWANFTSRGEFLFVGHEIEKVGNLSPLVQNFTSSALLFTQRGNGNDFFIGEPLLDGPVRWFLPIGFGVILWQALWKKNKQYQFMLFWFFTSLLPGILSVPNGNRDIGAIPPVYFMVAVGLVFVADRAGKLLPTKRSLVATVSIAFVCLVSLYSTYRDYLSPDQRELPGFYPETTIVSTFIQTIWDHYDIYLTDNYPRETLTYLLYRGGDPFKKNYTWMEHNTYFLSVTPSQAKGAAFFMFATPQNEGVAAALLGKFPAATKRYLWYNTKTIHRPAGIVLLVP